MPRVSQAYRDERSEQILDAARRCFARNGFHQTSMQDLLAEAGLSAGAVYRYFPSKDAMILAIAEQNMRAITDVVLTAAREHGEQAIGEVLAQVLEMVADKHRADGVGELALTAWAEAVRDPSLAQQYTALVGDVHDQIVALAAERQRAGLLPPSATPEGVAATFLTIVPGYILQLTLNGPDVVAGVPDAARSMWPQPAGTEPATT